MAILRYQPLSEIDRLQRHMNHLFDDFLAPNWRENNDILVHTPAAEIHQTEEAVYLKLEVPGMEAKDLNIEVSKDSVSITGERKQETKSEENGTVRTEFRYGKFQRVIPLPVQVQNTDVQAEYKDGILNLTLPKAEEEKNKVVKVSLG
ncbi:MAG: Hsp20/alpha crystallin family protein [Gomphosphaeria aponina SAG 52.96 = DSM 107014]|uniref:Hsp20/alpha crystallin family protein n=1 Tax=Gomphosphaeria aponina SAG 52.96 = DSM 107014 TaxID=1521640 RepID=A0A941GNE1_9CHRO|nr:Hsp20/alpha crystallin family protein [Gomphosphaeria aponina SAG 52.96 = DSM 107014]